MARRIVFPGPRRVALESTDPPPIERGMVAVQARYTLMSTGTDNILKRRYEPGTHRDAWVCCARAVIAADTERQRLRGFVREFRPQLLVTSDRSLASTELMLITSHRTWPPRRPESLTSAFDLPLFAADDPGPASAVTSPEHRPWLRLLKRGLKWRTFAVTSHERISLALATAGALPPSSRRRAANAVRRLSGSPAARRLGGAGHPRRHRSCPGGAVAAAGPGFGRTAPPAGCAAAGHARHPRGAPLAWHALPDGRVPRGHRQGSRGRAPRTAPAGRVRPGQPGGARVALLRGGDNRPRRRRPVLPGHTARGRLDRAARHRHRARAPPARLWVRRMRGYGFMYHAQAYRRVLMVATGAGVGPVLPYPLGKSPVQVECLWIGRCHGAAMGTDLVDRVLADGPVTLVDTSGGRPGRGGVPRPGSAPVRCRLRGQQRRGAGQRRQSV